MSRLEESAPAGTDAQEMRTGVLPTRMALRLYLTELCCRHHLEDCWCIEDPVGTMPQQPRFIQRLLATAFSLNAPALQQSHQF